MRLYFVTKREAFTKPAFNCGARGEALPSVRHQKPCRNPVNPLSLRSVILVR